MNSYLFKGEFVMIERRNIAVCIVLTLVTCGIYGIYWIVCLTNDVNTVSGDVNGTSGGMVVLLTIVTCGIYGIYWAYKQGEKLDFTKNNRGIPSRCFVSDSPDFWIWNYCICIDAERAE